jgi:hypothetical protein
LHGRALRILPIGRRGRRLSVYHDRREFIHLFARGRAILG